MDDTATITGAVDENQAADLITQIEKPVDDPAKEEATTEKETNEGSANLEGESEVPVEDLFEVKIDGETKKISKDELIAGYQKEAASAQRFEEAAQLRKQYEAENARIQDERNQTNQWLANQKLLLEQVINADTPNLNQLLAEGRTQEYLYHKDINERRQQALHALEQQQADLERQTLYQNQVNRNKFVQQEQLKLADVIPEWQDPAKAQEGKAAIAQYLSKFGYGPEVINQVADHREVLIAYKAMKYDQIQQQQAKANDKAVKAPPPKVEKPQGEGGITPKQAKMNRFRKSNSLDDAADVLADIIGEKS